MALKLRTRDRTPKWETVTFNGGSFELKIQPPDDRARHMDTACLGIMYGKRRLPAQDRLDIETRWFRDRVEACVLDWKDVVDGSGRPLPYSFDNLVAICNDYDEVQNAINLLLMNLFNEGETEQKQENESAGKSDGTSKPTSDPKDGTSPSEITTPTPTST